MKLPWKTPPVKGVVAPDQDGLHSSLNHHQRLLEAAVLNALHHKEYGDSYSKAASFAILSESADLYDKIEDQHGKQELDFNRIDLNRHYAGLAIVGATSMPVDELVDRFSRETIVSMLDLEHEWRYLVTARKSKKAKSEEVTEEDPESLDDKIREIYKSLGREGTVELVKKIIQEDQDNES